MPADPKPPGRDFSAVLRGEKAGAWDNTVFYEHESLRCVRTEDWKYVDRYGDGYDEIVECVDGQVRFFQTFLRTKAVAHPVYAEVRAGEPVPFDASSTQFPSGLHGKAYTWDFGDGG